MRSRCKLADIAVIYVSDSDLCNDTSLTGASCVLMEQCRKFSMSHPKTDHQPFSNLNSLTISNLSMIDTRLNSSPPTLHIHTIYLLWLLIDCMHETLTNSGNIFGRHCTRWSSSRPFVRKNEMQFSVCFRMSYNWSTCFHSQWSWSYFTKNLACNRFAVFK
jgi:hypothetical protein